MGLRLAIELLKNPWRRQFIWLLLAVNLAGASYGFWWYWPQLRETPAHLWFFTADCPGYGTLFAAILGAWLLGWKAPPWLQLLVSVGLVKYGLWYSLVILLHALGGGTIHWVVVLEVIAHLAMAAQGLAFLNHTGYGWGAWILNAGWMFFNDFLDYGLGIYPWLPQGVDALGVGMLTVGLTIAVALITKYFTKGRGNPYAALS